jgi:uncharacterized membrane protein HdeD (DUF308 family)
MSAIIADIRQIVRYWWIFSISGTSLIVFGLLVFAFPVAAYGALTVYFIAAFVINGLAEIGFGILNRRRIHGWGWHVAGGLFDLTVGLLLLCIPVLAAVSLPLFAGFWLLFRSIAIIGRSFDLVTLVWPERGWMQLLGLGGLVFSFMILYNPFLGAFTLITWTAMALLAIGLFYIFLGLHLREFYTPRPKK